MKARFITWLGFRLGANFRMWWFHNHGGSYYWGVLTYLADTIYLCPDEVELNDEWPIEGEDYNESDCEDYYDDCEGRHCRCHGPSSPCCDCGVIEGDL
jgi:hypothetical protein